MKSLLASKRSKAILGIGIVAIGIGAISKKVISYPAGGCMKGAQEMTFNKPLFLRIRAFNYQKLVCEEFLINLVYLNMD